MSAQISTTLRMEATSDVAARRLAALFIAGAREAWYGDTDVDVHAASAWFVFQEAAEKAGDLALLSSLSGSAALFETARHAVVLLVTRRDAADRWVR